MSPVADRGKGFHLRAFSVFLLCLCILLCQCHLRVARRTLSEVRQGIRGAEALGMEEEALYHLSVARDLLDEAEEQYEEADFTAAAQFAGQAK